MQTPPPNDKMIDSHTKPLLFFPWKQLFFKNLMRIQSSVEKRKTTSQKSLFNKSKDFSYFIIISGQGCIKYILCLMLPLYSFAQKNEGPIWIKAPQMPANEFKAHIKSLGFPHINYARHLLKQKRKRAKSFQLKDKLLVAQELYLSGDGEGAIKAFQKITKLAPLADWDKEDRRIILYSFLRIAQSEEDREKRKALLLSASAFALFKINNVNYPDYDLFPPPMMEELRLFQEKSNALFVDWKVIFPNHEIILINGEEMSKDQKAKIPQAFYRVSTLSSSHQPWSKNLNLSELLTQEIKTKRLTKGPCNQLKMQWNEEQKNIQILPFSACPKPAVLNFEKNKPTKKRKNHKKTFTKKTSEKNNSLDQFKPSDALYSIDSSLLNSEDFESQLEDEKQAKLSNIPPWLIVGAGVLVFSLVISLSHKKESKKGDYIY